MTNHEETTVASIPRCDVCLVEVGQQRRPIDRVEDAWCDGATQFGPWAFMCKTHFERVGVGLGLGRGQRLVLEVAAP